jgi:hypothetical protein
VVVCIFVIEQPNGRPQFVQRRQPPTGRRPGRPVGAKDCSKRAPYRRKKNLPADT